jgi:Flp pilus assembly protein TadG
MRAGTITAHTLLGTVYSRRRVVDLSEEPRRGSNVGPQKLRAVVESRRRDEAGAELVEFAIVVVLLLMLIFGIVSLGLSFAAKETITQSAADGARSGIVLSSIAGGESAALKTASGDLAWMGTTPITTFPSCTGLTTCSVTPCGSTGSGITCTAKELAACPSSSGNSCIQVNVSYDYADHPLFPTAFGLLEPSTIQSTATLQWNPTSS